MAGHDIEITGPDGTFSGYLSTPSAGTGPGVVVIQEIFGVNAVMRGVADALAARGYLALCPDLFWRIKPGIQITDQSKAEWDQAFALFNKFDVATGVRDIQTSITQLRHTQGCTGKVGTLGYCLGGQLAYLSATRTDSDASVGYYGVNIQTHLSEATNIKAPLLLHIAGKDQFVPKAAQEQIAESLTSRPLVTLHTYPEMDHAFARAGGEHFDKACADLANGRSQTFLRQHLS